MTNLRKRIWCETLSHHELVQAKSLDLLKRGPFEAIVAVQPESLDSFFPALAELQSHGIKTSVWPMLSNADGRWLSLATAPAYLAWLLRVVDTARATKTALEEIVIDLEPPFGLIHRMLNRDSCSISVQRAAAKAIQAQLRALRSDGVRISSAILPTQPFKVGRFAADKALGVPSWHGAFDAENVMLYSTLFEGWGRLPRPVVEAIMHNVLEASRSHFGPRAAVSLGAIGTGAFGNEPVYRSPATLAADIAIARACGICEIALFDLGGIVRRPCPEVWLETFAAQS
jgi:hypothetical protein